MLKSKNFFIKKDLTIIRRSVTKRADAGDASVSLELRWTGGAGHVS